MGSLRLLVLNAGSSSLKYDVVDVDPADAIGPADRAASGVIERVSDHGAATREALAAIGDLDGSVDGVAFRVVHGGPDLVEPAPLTAAVVARIEEVRSLAPLHNRAALATITAARHVLGDAIPAVAVFDTAFHASMPPAAARYAIPPELADDHGVRRYGFHGIAHRYLAERWAVLSGRPLEGSRLVTLQLGNGASVAAVAGGRSVDTSMGFTPLEGLVMGTRSGDVDPAVVVHLAAAEGVTAEEVLGWLNTRSGLLGLSGVSSDMRDVVAAAEGGDGAAAAAVEAFCYRARKYVGAYLAALGGADAVVFGGGIGEHQPTVRAGICVGMSWCGLELDPAANGGALGGTEASIGDPGATIEAWVIPVDEAVAIARQAAAMLP